MKISGQLSQKWNSFYFPKRYIVAILGFFGFFNIFAMRVSMSMSIVAMVNQSSLATKNYSHSQYTECPDIVSRDTTPSDDGLYKGNQYNWDSTVQASILGSYYYGYMLIQIPAGILAEKFGAKWLFGGGLLATAIFSLLTPVFTTLGPVVLSALRAIQGLADGLTIPAINLVISMWSPKNERSRLSTIIFTGGQIGMVVAMPIAALLCSTNLLGGWPSVFYVFGSISCVWFVLWGILISESPSMHPSISKEELILIEQDNGNEQSKKKSASLWKDIFTSIPMWALILGHFGHGFGFMVLLIEMPTFLSTALHYDMKTNGVLSSLPFVMQAIGAWVASYAADKLRKSNKISITAIRKIINSIGAFGPAICLMSITVSGCRPELIVTLLCLAMALNGCCYAGYNVTHVDMCPELAGTLYAITNTVANSAGFLAPMVVGIFTENGPTLSNWNKVFYSASGVYVFCGAMFAIFGSAELQNWNTSNSEKTNEVQEPKKHVIVVKTHL